MKPNYFIKNTKRNKTKLLHCKYCLFVDIKLNKKINKATKFILLINREFQLKL